MWGCERFRHILGYFLGGVHMLSFLYDLYNKKEKKKKEKIEHLYIEEHVPTKNVEEKDNAPQERGIAIIQL